MRRIAMVVFMVLVMGAAFVVFLTYATKKPAVNPFAKQETSGEASIGGHFSLTDQNGKPVTDADFRGKFMLVYFGFTFCPDVCPADLLTLSGVMEGLGDKAAEVVPVFITIDPERDTPAKLREYMQNFDPRIVGLTGSNEAIAQVAGAYKVYYSKVEDPSMQDYLMDHSAFTYLMDRNGKYLTHFPHDTASGVMVEKVLEYIK